MGLGIVRGWEKLSVTQLYTWSGGRWERQSGACKVKLAAGQNLTLCVDTFLLVLCICLNNMCVLHPKARTVWKGTIPGHCSTSSSTGPPPPRAVGVEMTKQRVQIRPKRNWVRSKYNFLQLTSHSIAFSFSKEYQADSGMVLAPEELKRFTWTGSKQKWTLFGSVFYVPFFMF